MDVEALLPGAGRVAVERLRIEPTQILIELRCTNSTAACPACGNTAARVHSRYVRVIRDLPWRGTPVRIELHARRFFCQNPGCTRRIFCEQLPEVATRRGRTTQRLDEALVAVGLECGGEPGRRLSAELGIAASGDTILRRLRAHPPQVELCPSAIGIDDFAFCRGQRYGTVIVDHESHRVMDLLPERSSKSTAQWLADQPQVNVVTRDRSGLYASGISAARPDAVQVADRFHLQLNLREALVRLLDRHHHDVAEASRAAIAPAQAQAATTEARQAQPDDASPAAPPLDAALTHDAEMLAVCMENAGSIGPAPLTKAASLSMERRARRLARYQEMLRLHQSGISRRAIARAMAIDRKTVDRLLRAGSFPERAGRTLSRPIDGFLGQLRELWDSGVRNAAEMYRTIRRGGFAGSAQMVRRCIAKWRQRSPQTATSSAAGAAVITPVRISSKQLSWLLLKDDVERDADKQRLIDELRARCEEVRVVADFGREFNAIMKDRRLEALAAWIERSSANGVADELRSFAAGLLRDWPSVKAAVELTWNNGRAEGHVNRIKLIKRKMYGRANFDLLRIRVLASGR